MAESRKDYLGDGVYADVESGMLKLTTEDGISVTNTIYLEADVWQRLLLYVERQRKAGAA